MLSGRGLAARSGLLERKQVNHRDAEAQRREDRFNTELAESTEEGEGRPRICADGRGSDERAMGDEFGVR